MAGLLRRRPWRASADVGRCYAGIAVGFGCLAVSESAWSLLAAFLLIGTQQHGLARAIDVRSAARV